MSKSNRSILLNNDIDYESVGKIINDIIEINSDDDLKEDQWFESMDSTILHNEIIYHEVIKSRTDWYIPADEAIELGLANHYYTREDQ